MIDLEELQAPMRMQKLATRAEKSEIQLEKMQAQKSVKR